jgi:hypothetical protein
LTVLTPEIFVFARKSTSNVRNAVFPSIFSKSPLFQDNILSGRCRRALDLFGRVFVDDVGLEPGSIISELGGGKVQEGGGKAEDLTISKIERERERGDSSLFREE